MFAIIETGGKQYRIEEGNVLNIEKVVPVNGEVTFDKVLLVSDGTKTDIGTPYLEGVTITAEVLSEGKGKKLHIQKFKSKSRYKRRIGHRQPYSRIQVAKI